MSNRNEQNPYLSGLICVNPVERHDRPTIDLDEADLRDYSYKYKVRVIRDEKAIEIKVCFEAFKSIFGVTNRRVQTQRNALTKTGKPPIDQRGKHKNRP